MIIEIQYLKERNAFRVDAPDDTVSSITACTLDDGSIHVSVLTKEQSASKSASDFHDNWEITKTTTKQKTSEITTAWGSL